MYGSFHTRDLEQTGNLAIAVSVTYKSLSNGTVEITAHVTSDYCNCCIFAARCYGSAACAVMRCPSVYLSRSWILPKRVIVFSKLFYDR